MIILEDKEPLLSIVICCFNYENYIESCIKSVLEQDVSRSELIIVDDGSSDSSWDIISKYLSVAKIFRIKNSGPLNASLFGLSKSSGAFVYFLDADDFLKSDALSCIYPYLGREISKIQFRMTPVDENGRVIGRDFPPLDKGKTSKDFIHDIARWGYYLTPPTSGNVYRRDVFDGLGDLSYEREIDGIAYLRAPFVGKVLSIECALAHYRNHGNNISSFRKMSSSQLIGYANRFEARLEHLKNLILKDSFDNFGLFKKNRYRYSSEMRIMATILEGKRPSALIIYRHIRAVKSEHSAKMFFFHVAFVLAILCLPRFVATKLIRLRFDQGYGRFLRSTAKWVIGRT